MSDYEEVILKNVWSTISRALSVIIIAISTASKMTWQRGNIYLSRCMEYLEPCAFFFLPPMIFFLVFISNVSQWHVEQGKCSIGKWSEEKISISCPNYQHQPLNQSEENIQDFVKLWINHYNTVPVTKSTIIISFFNYLCF